MDRTALRGYQQTIAEATGETGIARIELIEDIMRQDIFHSTLDWQTKAQLKQGARQAVAVINEATRLGIVIA